MYYSKPSQFKTFKKNPNLTITRKHRYKGYPVCHYRGPLITQYLDDILGTLNIALCESEEVVVYRFDLRFPYWIDVDDLRELSLDLITRFWASVVSQLESRVNRLQEDGCDITLSRFRNIWCKELPGTERTPHYHAALIVDAELFKALGEVVVERVVKEAWARVTGITLYEAPNSVWIPENNIYYIVKDNLDSYADAFFRLSYLAKSATKLYHDGSQWFGSTRL
jgi:Inovirus Gp2